MPRRARVPSSTGYYHVIMRGNNKEYIFKHQRNKQYYKQLLFKYQEEGLFTVGAWCIMDNHIHLVLESSELAEMSSALHDMNMQFAQHYHRDQRTYGHVFQDRFKTENVEDDDYLTQVVRYVHNNPVKAKMVKDALDYPWSSFRAYEQNILTQSMRLTFSLFGYEWKRFYDYHQQEDEREFLEIKEDREKYRLEKAQRIVAGICKEQGVYDQKDIQMHPEIMEEVIIILISRSGLSLEKIAKFLGVPYSCVQRCRRQ